ncbi:MAG: type II toxin-antitoxin system VapC family toxin [Clostridia bacterium]|nr:type II toxin-antitoxin system VapC family toxin [Clostridia bacterium]
MYLLDTNICIYFMKNQYPQLTERLFACNPADLMISSVTVFELEYGAAKSNWGNRTREKLAMFLAPFYILPFSMEDAVSAGRLRGYLEKQGTPIGPYDVQIAAQGLSRNLTLITHNMDEFRRVPHLQLEDWVV